MLTLVKLGVSAADAVFSATVDTDFTVTHIIHRMRCSDSRFGKKRPLIADTVIMKENKMTVFLSSDLMFFSSTCLVPEVQ